MHIYAWAMVHFEELDNDGDMIENIYLSQILGFISIKNELEAVIQCSLKTLCWNDVEKYFIQGYNWKLILTFCL